MTVRNDVSGVNEVLVKQLIYSVDEMVIEVCCDYRANQFSCVKRQMDNIFDCII